MRSGQVEAWGFGRQTARPLAFVLIKQFYTWQWKELAGPTAHIFKIPLCWQRYNVFNGWKSTILLQADTMKQNARVCTHSKASQRMNTCLKMLFLLMFTSHHQGCRETLQEEGRYQHWIKDPGSAFLDNFSALSPQYNEYWIEEPSDAYFWCTG